jgi:multicomponent Na+:H+ antiporter subunit A
MLLLALALPLAAIIACLALSRVVASRWLGIGAAGALLVLAGVLGALRSTGLPIVLAERDWLVIGGRAVRLLLRLDAAGWPLALLALLGGALALAALALALPHDLRGFGGLLAALLCVPLATVLGLATAEPLLLPFAWMLSALAGFLALRASGALATSDAPLVALAAGAGGALIAFATGLLAQTIEPGAPLSAGLLTGVIALAMLALGAPPLHATVASAAEAPAAIAAIVVALGLPLLGGYVLLDVAAGLGPVAPPEWRAGLVALGALALLASAAGGLGVTRMRQIVGWQLSAQAGALLMAAGMGGAALTAAGPALLANSALTALAMFLALGALERRTGSDDLAALGGRGPFPLPGLTMLIAGASAAGFPGTLGFWGRLWLADELMRAAPWAVPPLLAGSALLAFGAIAPVAAFWRRGPAADAQEGDTSAAALAPLAAALPLLLAGVAPALLWRGWLAGAQRALAPGGQATPPALPGSGGQIAAALAAVALVVLPLMVGRGAARLAYTDPDARADGIIPPTALGQSLRSLAWAGAPNDLIAGLWSGVQSLSAAAGRALALLERRYYLAGLLIAMIVVILIFL